MDTGKLKWKMMRVVADIAISSGGAVFGGYLRDGIVHNNAADEFYRTRNPSDVYEDLSVAPELSSRRMLVPKDIDVFFQDCHLVDFLDRMAKADFNVKKIFTRTSDYLGRMPTGMPDDVSHSSFSVQIAVPFVLKNFIDVKTMPSFSVDVIHSTNPDSLTHFNIDFECNGLVMTANGLFLSPLCTIGIKDGLKKYEELTRIINDIKMNRARACLRNIEPNRLRSMIKKGWQIEIGESVVTTFGQPYDGHCIICHEGVGTKSVKLKCCDARYHAGCLHRAITEGVSAMYHSRTCVVCRKDVNVQLQDAANVLMLTRC